MDTQTRTISVPLSLGTAETTITVTGEVTQQPQFKSSFDEAVGLWIYAITGSLSSLGTKSGLRGEAYLNTTTARFDLDLGDNTYGFIVSVGTDMQGVTKLDVAKLLSHLSCQATTIVEFIEKRSKPKPKSDLAGLLGAWALGEFFGSTPRGGTEKLTRFDPSGLLFKGPGSMFGGESHHGDM